MKMNGKKSGRFTRFLAILCAAVLTIQAVPAGWPASFAVSAAASEESSGEDADKKAEEEKKKKEEEEKKKKEEEAKKAEEEKKKEEEAKKAEEESKKSDDTSKSEEEKPAENKDDSKSETTEKDQKTEESTDTSKTKDTTKSSDNSNSASSDQKQTDDTAKDANGNNTVTEPAKSPAKAPLKAPADNSDENALKDSDIEIKKGDDTVSDDVEVGKDGDSPVSFTVDIKKAGVNAANYSFKWSVSKTDGSDADEKAVDLKDENEKTVKVSPVKGKKAGKLKLTVEVTPTGDTAGDKIEKSITLDVYTKYGVKDVELKKKALGKDNEEKISDGKAEVTDTLIAELTFEDGTWDGDDKDDYSYEWYLKPEGGDKTMVGEGTGTKAEFDTGSKGTGTYSIKFTRDADKNRLKYESDEETVEVETKKITAVIKLSGRNFNNTTAVANDATVNISWQDKDGKDVDPSKNGESAGIKIGSEGKELNADALVYKSAGSVDEDKEVEVTWKDNNSGNVIAFTGIDEELYSATDIKFEKATIKKVDMTASETASPVEGSGVANGDVTYVAKGSDDKASIKLKSLDGYTIADKLEEENKVDNFTAEEVTCSVEDGGAVFYAKNAAGDIAKVTLDSVQIDGDGPAITPGNKTVLSNSETSDNTFTIKDEKSGLDTDSVYMLISETAKDDITFDAGSWKKVESVSSEDGSCSITIPVPSFGHVYIYAKDKLGNDTIQTDYDAIYDGEKPTAEVTLEDADKPSKTKKINLTGKDSKKDDHPASGVEKFKLTLLDKDNNPVKFSVNSDNLTSEEKENEVYLTGDGDRPEKIDDIKDSSELTAAVELSGEKLSGAYKLQVTAIDYCGNESSTVEQELVFDTTAPVYTIKLFDQTGSDVGGKYYYNASFAEGENSGLTVTFEDDYLNLGGTYKVVLKSGSESKEKSVAPDSGTSATVNFTKDEIKELPEGEVSVIVTAVDAAGNAADADSNKESTVEPETIKVDPSDEGENALKAASFVLDTTPPVLVESLTTTDLLPGMDLTDSSPKYNEINGKAARYSYPGTFTTEIKITDKNIDASRINKTGYFTQNVPEEIAFGETSEDENNKGTVKVTYQGLNKGYVGSLCVEATDFAGNPLTIDDVVKAAVSDSHPSQDQWSLLDTTTGKAITTCERELNSQKPLATITYPVTDNVVVKEQNEKTSKSAYYNKEYVTNKGDLIATVNITRISTSDVDAEKPVTVVVEKDGQEIFSIPISKTNSNGSEGNNSYKTEVSNDTDNNIVNNIKITISQGENGNNDGSYTISVIGKNYAGIPVYVKEKEDPSGNTSQEIEGGSYNPYAMVLDTVGPMVTFNLKTPPEPNGPSKPDLNNNRFYWNTTHEFTAEVIEKNVKDDFKISYEYISASDYTTINDIAKKTFSSTELVPNKVKNDTYEYTYNNTDDGVIRYCFGGTDLAGNPVTFQNCDDYLDKTSSGQGSSGNEVIRSYEIVTDRTQPEITLEYSDSDDKTVPANDIYFNKERTATVTLNERTTDYSTVDELKNALNEVVKKDGKKVPVEQNYSDSNKPQYEYQLIFTKDGIYDLSILNCSAQNTQNQEINVENSAFTDLAGNKASLKVKGKVPFHFIIDQTAPDVSIIMSGSEDLDGNYYYNASNCGIQVVFQDNGNPLGGDNLKYKYSAKVTNPSGGAEIAEVSLEKDKTDDHAEWTTDKKKVTLTWTPQDVAILNEGPNDITVTAKDLAGNETSNVICKGCKPVEGKTLTGRFILDKTSPVVTKIETSPDNYPATDNQLYDDTNCVYYNQPVVVSLTIEDSYIGIENIKGNDALINCDGEDSKVAVEKSNVPKSGIKVAYMLPENHKYTDLRIKGTDKAGNPLKLKGDGNDYSHSACDELKQNGEWIQSEHGKVIDKIAPTATITYQSSDQANMYSGETKGKTSAYYNKPVTVQMAFNDNNELDGKKLYAGLEGKAKQQTGNTKKQFKADDIVIKSDGRSSYTAYGTDRALNATVVTEKVPVVDPATPESGKYKDNVKKAGAFKDNTLTSQTSYQAAYEIVLDQVAPTFKLAVASPASTNKSLNTQGNRYYFNKQYTATCTVTDTNLDPAKITMIRGSITDGNYNSETASVTSYPDTISSKTGTFADKVNAEGVYRYAVYGSDKAGNALVPADRTNLQTTTKDGKVVKAENEKKRGSLEKEADVSNHIVIDKTVPEGELEIKTGNTTIYKMNTKGNVTFAEPYRKETNASFKITVNDKVERTPVNIAYKVDSTSGSNKKNVSNSTYKYNNSAAARQNGKQVFKVTEYTFTDLAGNTRTYKPENHIYLDKDLPNIDKIAPTINIVARAKSGTNGYRNGQPLFRSDVPINIIVSDPDASNSSSGLADVKYEMYVGGRLVGGDTRLLNKANTKTHKSNYKDEKLTYRLNQTINVNGKSHNNNDLEVVVTAFDNAGNKREMKYNFGIDVTAPTVKVTYDNNSAQNGEYFKANRTATVAVTERNFEPSKFKISTQSAASISGWSHSGKGGNGDNDVWTAHVTYSRDGNYTLEVSGEDLLGNKASNIQYEGTAPRKFTIDKTAPSITVTYDNNDVRNEKYYKATRTATINVNDVNFGGQNDIRVSASGGGRAPSVSFSGNTAHLYFPEDGVYIFNGTVTDKAGNQSTIPVQTEFVIDTKPPVLVFDADKPFKLDREKLKLGSDHPTDYQFFTEDGFAPVVTVIDTNISTAEQDAIFEIIGQKAGNHFTGTPVVHSDDSTKFDMGISSLTFKVDEKIDDVYHVRAIAVDLAGNESDLVEFTFSINRFGSSYEADRNDNPDGKYPYSTYGYLRESYYHNSTRDLTIYEYNTNGLKKDSQKVEMMKDGNTADVKTLAAGTDYTFEEVPNRGDKLRTYRYVISSSVFEEEGDYDFIISSEDEAKHKNTTARVHKDKDKNGNAGMTVDSFPINFVIDKTAPVNQLAGVASGRKQAVNDRNLVVDVYPEDAQTAVSKVVIKRWIGDTLGMSVPKSDDAPAQTVTYEYYDEKDNQKPADTETEKYEDLTAFTNETTGKIAINYEITDNQNWQWVEVITTDLAGNDSEDIRAASSDDTQGIRYSENRRGFLVTTNTFSQIINNMAARIGALGAILLLLLILILRKRKKDRENNAAA